MSIPYRPVYLSILDHPSWQDKPFSNGQFLVHIYLKANWREEIVNFNRQNVVAYRGQLVTSTLELARQSGWTEKKVRVHLAWLTKRADIRANIRANRYVVITLCNYETFPSCCEAKGRTEGRTEGRTGSRKPAPGAQPQAPYRFNRFNNNTPPNPPTGGALYQEKGKRKKRRRSGPDLAIDETEVQMEHRIKELCDREKSKQYARLLRDGNYSEAAMNKVADYMAQYEMDLLQAERQKRNKSPS